MCTGTPKELPDVLPRGDNLGVDVEVFWGCFGGVLGEFRRCSGGVPEIFWGYSGGISLEYV